MKKIVLILSFFTNYFDALSQTGIYNSFLQTNDSILKTDSVGVLKLLSVFENTYGNTKNYLLYSSLLNARYQSTLKKDKEAISLYLSSVRMAEESKNDSLKALAYRNLGSYCLRKSNLEGALGYLNKALLFKKQLRAVNEDLNLLKDIGLINSYLDNNKRAIFYYKKAVPLAEAMGNKKILGTLYNNLALNYLDINDSINGGICMRKSLKYRLETNDRIWLGQNYNNIGTLNFKYKQYEKALAYYQMGYAFRKEFEQLKSGQVESETNIGKTYIELGNETKALEYLEKALSASLVMHNLKLEKNASEPLIDIYISKGKYPQAIQLLHRYYLIKDSLYGLDKKEKINRLSSQLMFAMKQREDSLKYEENQRITALDLTVKDERVKRQNVIIIFVVLALLLCGLLLFQVNKSNRKTKVTNKIITEQRDELTVKQKEIVDSLNYAQKIQNTLFVHREFLDENVKQSFIFMKPKDIVSGDFYWATTKTVTSAGAQKRELFFLAVCDSTGHGVPGAFMSLLNISFLNEAVNEKNIYQPHHILDYVRERLIANVSKDGQQDGFDGILLCINKTAGRVTYAAANNAPLLISDSKTEELPFDRMPVGQGERKEKFSLHTLKADEGAMLYLYTDGYADQFGGPRGKKFKNKQLDELLLQISGEPLENQQEILEKIFEDWRGNLEQVDDVCIIGIRL